MINDLTTKIEALEKKKLLRATVENIAAPKGRNLVYVLGKENFKIDVLGG